METSSKEIKKKIRSVKAEIKKVKREAFDKLQELNQKKITLQDSLSFRKNLIFANGEKTQKVADELSEVKAQIAEVKINRNEKIEKLDNELQVLNKDYRDNYDSYLAKDKKIQDEKILDLKRFFIRNKTLFIIVGGLFSALLVTIIVNIIRNNITTNIELGRYYYIQVEDELTFDCNAKITGSSNYTQCSERTIQGEFSNYNTTKFLWDYSIEINGVSFAKRVSTSINRSIWEKEDFNVEELSDGIDQSITLTLWNEKLDKGVATKTIKIHYNLTDEDKQLISDNHAGWVAWNETERARLAQEEERRQLEEQERKKREAEETAAREEAERKAAEEAAAKKAQEEAEEAARKEAATTYKWKAFESDGSCAKNAQLCINQDKAYGYADYGYGTVQGRIYNNTGKNISYMSVSASVYNASGAKLGDCYDNVSGLKIGGTWAFEMYCAGWSKGGTISDYDITWW